ncbi:MAG: isoleucine--tRNA ligase [Candidatus Cloacimonetes bacterium]|nr:isoleucine--tRNA ligase [Candidatus Cloacimonadota bacterium]
MYKLIDLKEKSSDFEKRIRDYWHENGIVLESMQFRQKAPKFIFYEGPPTANGKPGIHHVISRAIKDTVCRYKTMKGYEVNRKAGWDTHGLPVEIEVEKQLGLKDKNAIEKYGVEKFCQKCKESVFNYEKEWRQMTEMMGYWIDLDNPYITLENNYIESVWWILNQFWNKGIIYQGHKIVPYCPSCETPLSSHEVALGYRDVEDPSVFVKFKATDEKDTYYLAWTTTPWTLISNVALVVNPEEAYVKIKHQDEYLYLAKDSLSVIDGEYDIIQEMPGKDLSNREYEQLFPFIKPELRAFFIATADYVTTEDGTGIVHTAPAFGQDDYNTGLKYELPFLQPVDELGKFTAEITDWAGLFVKDADKGIMRNLKDRGLLYKRAQITHSYPFCWRCDWPLIYFARSSWYIRTSEFKELMMEENRKIKWYPPFVGEKRFGEWLENNVDWAISRNRFWGTPLNIWLCENCDYKQSIGSIEELKKFGKQKNGEPVLDDIELHRPYIDDIELTCPHCQSKMNRTPEVIDCWFDSGSMPFAQWHYPFEREEEFDTDLFPADFISEGIDQTRGWFYTMLAISTILKGRSSFRSVLVNDLILDKTGQKMSKSKGNTVNPVELMQQYGADAIRWYLLAVSPPWVPTKFDTKGVEEVLNKLIGTMKNVYSFFATYANIDQYETSEDKIDPSEFTADLDRWIVSRFHSLVTEINYYNERYELTRSVRLLQDFILDELSNWYVRRARRRYWAMSLTKDKEDAYKTLFYVMVNVSKLLAPFAPYLAEEIYTNLTKGKSVHLTDYPLANPDYIDKKLEEEMGVIIDLVSLGRTARNNCHIKVRQTLQALYVPQEYQATAEKMAELIKEEINVKEILFLENKSQLVDYIVKPNFKTMGPKYGKYMKQISSILEDANANQIVDMFNKGKSYYISVEGNSIKIDEDDLFITYENKEGFVLESEKDKFVALDIRLTPELIKEGFARELVNKIQYTRKELDFEIMDNIEIKYSSDDELAEVFEQFAEYIKNETLTVNIERTSEILPDMKKMDINGKDVYLIISKIV